jgi:hypothetical protein
MAEENYGALTGLNLDDPQYQGMSPITYNVYKQQTARPDAYTDQDIQRLYGTGAMPVFEWVRKVKSGERTYNPQDAYDQSMMEQYQDLTGDDSLSEADIMKQKALQGTAGAIGLTVGTPIGKALANPYYEGMDFTDKAIQGGKNIWQKTPQQVLSNASDMTATQRAFVRQNPDYVYKPQLKDAGTAESLGLTNEYDELSNSLYTNNKGQVAEGFYKTDAANKILGNDANALAIEQQQLVPSDTAITSDGTYYQDGSNPEIGKEIIGRDANGNAITRSSSGNPTMGIDFGEAPTWDFSTSNFDPTTVAGKSNLYSSGTGALFNFGFRVASGQDVEGAAKSAADAGIVTYLTTALLMGTPLAPFSGIIGGLVGGAVGRVICNELMRQGVMDRKQVLLDYKFTRDYLTPQHVNGYHVWAVWMVKQMRKGKLVGFWSHVAGHRANEIAYIYGERKKPDYLGKLYRKILEPICWGLGAFCKETDWSVLYTKKEI